MEMTREHWLGALADALRPEFDAAGFALPANVKTSCGWPSKSALAKKNQRVGECWSDSCSKASMFEIFVSPVIADSVAVGAILVHELAHAAVGLACGHKGDFRRCAKAIGLEGKMTATTAGEALTARLHALVATLGPYPHGELAVSNKPKTQTTRMVKVECPDCGCVVRMTRKWLDGAGCPSCACGALMAECV